MDLNSKLLPYCNQKVIKAFYFILLDLEHLKTIKNSLWNKLYIKATSLKWANATQSGNASSLQEDQDYEEHLDLL